jgi:hypothetical protein
MRRFLLPVVLLATSSALPAAAQEMGGVRALPQFLGQGAIQGLARPLVSAFPGIGAADLQASVMPTAADRRQQHQNLIARVRGDGGFLDGFSQGQPLAASRQRQPSFGGDPAFGGLPVVQEIFAPTINRTILRNQFQGPVAITRGNNNVVLQQGSQSGGTNAQQQVVNIGRDAGRSGGATNIAAPGGSVLQQAPGLGRGPRMLRGPGVSMTPGMALALRRAAMPGGAMARRTTAPGMGAAPGADALAQSRHGFGRSSAEPSG